MLEFAEQSDTQETDTPNKSERVQGRVEKH